MRVTRDVEAAALRELLERPRRAAVSFVEDGEVTILPARACVEDGVHQFSMAAGAAPDLSGREGTASCHHGFPPLRVLLHVTAKYYVSPRALLVELRHAAQWWLRLRYYAGVQGGPGYIRVEPTAAEFLSAP